MTAIGMDVQETTVAEFISRDIMCLSCSGPVVMGFGAMVGLVIKLDIDLPD